MKTPLPIPQAEKLCQSQPAEVLVLLQSCRQNLQGDALAQALFWMGEAHYKLSNYAAAFGCFHEALQITIQDPTIAAELHWHLAILHNEMGAFEESLHQLHFVLSMGNPDQKLRAKYKISSAYLGLQQPLKALEVLQEVWSERLVFADAGWFSKTLSQMAYTHFQIGLLPQQDQHKSQQEALQLLTDAEHCLQAFPYPGVEGLIQLYRGQIHAAAGDWEQAEQCCQHTLGIANLMHYTWLRLEGLLALASLHRSRHQHEAAVELLQESLQSARSAGLLDKVARAYEMLSDSLEQVGRYSESLEALKTAHALHRQFAQQRADWLAKSIQARSLLEQALQETESLRQRSKQLEDQTRELHDMLQRDALTGVLNRRGMLSEMQERQQAGQPFVLVMLDVDHFKQVNDQHGHPVGDAVLVALGGILGGSIREQDRVARYGGEEFMVLLDQMQPEEAFWACERLRLAVAAFDWDRLDAGLHITASFGFVSSQVTTSCAGLIQQADQFLYDAKRAGRNCCKPELGFSDLSAM